MPYFPSEAKKNILKIWIQKGRNRKIEENIQKKGFCESYKEIEGSLEEH